MAGARAKPVEPAERPLEELRRLFDEGGPEALSSEEMERLEAEWAAEQLASEADAIRAAEEQPAEEPPVFGRQGNPAHSFQPGSAMLGTPEEELDAAQREDYPIAVHEAIAEVTRRIGAISKTRQADQRAGGYRFRGIDDVLLALHPILGDVGLLLLPGEIAEHRRETRATSGSPLNVAILRVRFLLVGPDGSQLWGEAWGEGGDSGDKATQKAMSQAYKSFALQTFSIPTEQSAADDPDASNEPARSFTADEVGRASNAWQAAKQAGNLEELSGVRSRALHLLAVPVPLPEENSSAPLGVLFDRRRAELEQAGGQG